MVIVKIEVYLNAETSVGVDNVMDMLKNNLAALPGESQLAGYKTSVVETEGEGFGFQDNLRIFNPNTCVLSLIP